MKREMSRTTAAALGLAVLLTSSLHLRPVAAVSSGCTAHGSSDGVTAEALATCVIPPDGLVLTPLNCQFASYHLVVADDTTTAVFPNRVVKDHSLTAAPADTSYEAEGFANNYGTVVDALGNGAASFIGSEVYRQFGDRRFSATGRWWGRTCWATAEDGLFEPVVTDGPFPEGPEVPLSDLVAVARARVNPPPVPPVIHAGPASVIQLSSWFWVDRGWWEASYRHRVTHGLMSVSVAAVPARWSLTNLETDHKLLECEGPGKQWHRKASEVHACTHTFTEGQGGSVHLSLTIELEVYWTSSIVSYGIQALDPLSRTTVSDLPVVEVVGLGSS